MTPGEIAARLDEEARAGRLPLLRGERSYSTVGMLATGFSYAVAAWCFLIGGYAAGVVGAARGAIALLAGSVLGVALSAAAAALACNRYGLEQLDYAKTCFGQRGARLILVFYVVNQIGWTGMILVMFGRGVADVAGALGAPFGAALVRPAVVVGALAAYAIVVRGVRLLDLFNRIVTPGLLLVTALLFFVILRDGGGAALLARPPLAPPADARLGYVLAFEYGLGAGFSWWPGIGFLARHADGQRSAFYPQVVTLGLGMGVVSCAGLFAALRFGTPDPTRWMAAAGGPGLALAALALIGLANVSASAIMMSTAALACRHVRALRALPLRTLAAATFAPLVLYVAVPERLFQGGSAFLAWNATVFAPISGVLLVDYLVLRRGRIDAAQVFEGDRGGAYWFAAGFNVPALVSVLVGQAVYVWLLDPVSLTARGPVRFLTASGPAVVAPIALYYVLARVWLVRRGVGGYGPAAAPRPLRAPDI
jgi:NCS1 family nucleobase:cation symporter-1